MSDEEKSLLLTNPKGFLELVLTDDPAKRVEALCGSLDDMALCEIVRYGVYNDQKMIEPLAAFYKKYFSAVPEERRWQISRHVLGLVQETTFVSTNAFLPFIVEDRSSRIVSTAVIDYVSLGDISDGDAMSRVKEMAGLIESGQLKNEGAAFGGLLSLGDDRVCALLAPLRDQLDNPAIKVATNCQTGLMHAATVEFYFDWMERMDSDRSDGVLGLLASGLILLRRQHATGWVSTGRRPFPVRGVSEEEWRKLAGSIEFDAYVERIAPRLYALERTEPPPRVMPHVLREWGLPPRTDPSEAVVLPGEQH